MVKSAQRQEPSPRPHMASFAPLFWLVPIKGVPVTETPKMAGYGSAFLLEAEREIVIRCGF